MQTEQAPLGSFVLSIPIQIRPCQKEDLFHLEWYGAFELQRGLIRQAFERHQAGVNVMLVADGRGFPVGQIWIDLEKKRREGAGILWALRVLPFLQGAGIGGGLIHAAEGVLRLRGLVLAEIGVEKGNAGALRLYERLGFTRVGEEVEDVDYAAPDGTAHRMHVDQWLLRKRLGE